MSGGDKDPIGASFGSKTRPEKVLSDIEQR
jgi:hypothetical protein